MVFLEEVSLDPSLSEKLLLTCFKAVSVELSLSAREVDLITSDEIARPA